MRSTPEPLAIAFANTLSSRERDRIATLEQFTTWAAAWPSVSQAAVGLPAAALAPIREQRDATQQVLHRLAAREPVPVGTLHLATGPGLAAAPFVLVPEYGGMRVDGEPGPVVRHLLGRAAIDLVIGPDAPLLRRCAGSGCHRVFLARRPDRRWCDSRVCGNRMRVAAHARRRAEESEPRPGRSSSDGTGSVSGPR